MTLYDFKANLMKTLGLIFGSLSINFRLQQILKLAFLFINSDVKKTEYFSFLEFEQEA